MKLTMNFYDRDVHKVAKELLGKLLVRHIGNSILSGIIAEVEAYDGSVDEASHSFRGRTARNEVMFRGGGLLYVYFTYGMHCCCNVVTGKGVGKAVLIRAIEPVDGLELMARNRFDKEALTQKEFLNLSNGPAKVCQALGIGMEQNGTDLNGKEIYLLKRPAPSPNEIVSTRRIGIKKSVDLPWRYYLKDNRFVSKK
jgi:DNA-3-methyladenine glycosylase